MKGHLVPNEKDRNCDLVLRDAINNTINSLRAKGRFDVQAVIWQTYNYIKMLSNETEDTADLQKQEQILFEIAS